MEVGDKSPKDFLEVTILGATGLEVARMDRGVVSPYVTVSAWKGAAPWNGDLVFTTEAVDEAVNPVWQEGTRRVARIPLPAEMEDLDPTNKENDPPCAEFSIFHANETGEPTCLGVAKLLARDTLQFFVEEGREESLDMDENPFTDTLRIDIPPTGESDRELFRGGSGKRELSVSIQYCSGSDDDKKKEQKEKTMDYLHALEVTVRSAQHLPNTDSAFAGSSDPFVKVLDCQGELALHTEVINDSVDPVWPEGSSSKAIVLAFDPLQDPPEGSSNKLTFQVWNWNTMQNDCIGEATLDLKRFAEVEGLDKRTEIDLVLEKPESGTHKRLDQHDDYGFLHVALKLTKEQRVVEKEEEAAVPPPPAGTSSEMPAILDEIQEPKSAAQKKAVETDVVSSAVVPASKPAAPTSSASGKLEITIRSAEGLADTDGGGLSSGVSDPFVTVLDSDGKEVLKTKTVGNSLNPVWPDYQTSATTMVSCPVGGAFKFRVWNWNKGEAHDCLGEVCLESAQYSGALQPKELSLALRHPDPTVHTTERLAEYGEKLGRINVTIHFIEDEADALKKDSAAVAPPVVVAPTVVVPAADGLEAQHDVSFYIASCSNLLDRSGHGGYQYPLVKVLDVDRNLALTTKTRNDWTLKTLDPTWCPEAATVKLKLTPGGTKFVEFQAWNRNPTKNDFLGSVRMSEKDVFAKSSGPRLLSLLPRETENDPEITKNVGKLGSIKIFVTTPGGIAAAGDTPPLPAANSSTAAAVETVAPQPKIPGPGDLAASDPAAQNNNVSGKLKITIRSAEGLPDIDGGSRHNPEICGESDHFVKVIDSAGKEVLKTETVRNSLNPVWSEDTSTTIVPLAGTGNIKLQVWNWDPVGDDCLGEVCLESAQYSGALQPKELSLALRYPDPTDDDLGEINITVQLLEDEHPLVSESAQFSVASLGVAAAVSAAGGAATAGGPAPPDVVISPAVAPSTLLGNLPPPPVHKFGSLTVEIKYAPPPPEVRHEVTVSILHARGLKKASGLSPRQGKPYVLVDCTWSRSKDMHFAAYRTEAMKGTDPDWPQGGRSTATVKLPADCPPEHGLEFRVMDSRIISDDCLGKVLLKLGDLAERASQAAARGESGAIRCEFPLGSPDGAQEKKKGDRPHPDGVPAPVQPLEGREASSQEQTQEGEAANETTAPPPAASGAASRTIPMRVREHPSNLEITVPTAHGLTHRLTGGGSGMGGMRQPRIFAYLVTHRVAESSVSDIEGEENAEPVIKRYFQAETLILKTPEQGKQTLNPSWTVKDVTAEVPSRLMVPYSPSHEVSLRLVVFDMMAPVPSGEKSARGWGAAQEVGLTNTKNEGVECQARPEYYGECSVLLSSMSSGKSVERQVKIKDGRENATNTRGSGIGGNPGNASSLRHPAATLLQRTGPHGALGSVQVILNTTERSTLTRNDFKPVRHETTPAPAAATAPAPQPRPVATPNIIFGRALPSPLRRFSGSRPGSADPRHRSSSPATAGGGQDTSTTQNESQQEGVAPSGPATRPMTAKQRSKEAKEEARLRKRSDQDSHDIFMFFQKDDYGWAAEKLIKSNFTSATLEGVTIEDLEKLRITNKKDQRMILEIARAYKNRPSAASRSQLVAAVDPNHSSLLGDDASMSASSAAGTVSTHLHPGHEETFSQFTATTATANECARKATVFLDHHHVDKQWPFPGSELSKVLNLSNAAPSSHLQKHLYDIKIDDKTKPAVELQVKVPKKHEHGFSAKFCNTCLDHVSSAIQGSWQFQQLDKVLIGDGEYDHVLVWKPFHKNESLKIEYALKRKKKGIKVRSKMVMFDTMRWGGDKLVRRVEVDAIPFPSLRPKDVVTAPTTSFITPQMETEMDTKLNELALTLSVAEEKKARLKREQEEERQLNMILARIAAMMLDYHENQRAELEEEETVARLIIEGPEFEQALDDIFDWEEASVRDVALAEVRKEADKAIMQQLGLIEDMEVHGRKDVEAHEEASMKNLFKMIGQLNSHIHGLLEAAAKASKKKEWQAQNKAKLGKGDELRCLVCRKKDCPFFRKPWSAVWKQKGGPPEYENFLEPEKGTTLNLLMAEAGEKEYQEYMQTKKAQARSQRLREHMQKYLTNDKEGDTSNIAGASPIQKLEGPERDMDTTDQQIHNEEQQQKKKKPAWQPASTNSKASRARDLAFTAREEEALGEHEANLSKHSTVQALYKNQPPFTTILGEPLPPPLTKEEIAAAKVEAAKRPPSAHKPAWGGGNGGSRPQTPTTFTRSASRTPPMQDAASPGGARGRSVTPPTAGGGGNTSMMSSSSNTTGVTKKKTPTTTTEVPMSMRRKQQLKQKEVSPERPPIPYARVSLVVLCATDLALPEGWTEPTVTLTRLSMKDDPSMMGLDSVAGGGSTGAGGNGGVAAAGPPSRYQLDESASKPTQTSSAKTGAGGATGDEQAIVQQEDTFVARSNGTAGNKRTFLEAFALQDVDLESEMLRVQCWALKPATLSGVTTSSKKHKTNKSVLLAELSPPILCFRDYLKLPDESQQQQAHPGSKCEGFFPMPYLPHMKPLVLSEDDSGGLPVPKLQLRMSAQPAAKK